MKKIENGKKSVICFLVHRMLYTHPVPPHYAKSLLKFICRWQKVIVIAEISGF